MPPEIRAATDEYRSRMDVLGDFLEERCNRDPQARVEVGALYDAYQGWAKDCGERPLRKRDFGARLSERGVTRGKGTKGVRIWQGIELTASNWGEVA